MTGIAETIVQMIFATGLLLVLSLLALQPLVDKICTWLDHRYMRKQLTILFTNHCIHNIGRKPNLPEMKIFSEAIEPLIKSNQYIEALERTKLLARTIVKLHMNMR